MVESTNIENASQRSSVSLFLSDHTYSSDMAWSSAKLGPQLSFTVSVDNEQEGVGEKILAQAIRNFEDYNGTVSRIKPQSCRQFLYSSFVLIL